MKTEKEKMLAGELYLASDAELDDDRLRARMIVKRFNDSLPEEKLLRKELLAGLFGRCTDDVWIEPPFRCDYGSNIFLGRRVQVNFNCVMLDVCKIEIGDDTLIAPNVQIYAATHPLDWRIRKHNGPELGQPVRIGDDCWLGGGVIVCPGVTIGDRCVIGAGSVVTKDIPPDSLAMGVPAKVVKRLE